MYGLAKVKTPEGIEELRLREKGSNKEKVRRVLTDIANKRGVITSLTVRRYKEKP